MQTRESKPEYRARYGRGAFFAGGAKDEESEQEGGDELRQRRGPEAIASKVTRAPSVLAETGPCHIIAGDLALQDRPQDKRPNDAADQLRHHVADGLLAADSACRPHPRRHVRIDMTSPG